MFAVSRRRPGLDHEAVREPALEVARARPPQTQLPALRIRRDTAEIYEVGMEPINEEAMKVPVASRLRILRRRRGRSDQELDAGTPRARRHRHHGRGRSFGFAIEDADLELLEVEVTAFATGDAML